MVCVVVHVYRASYCLARTMRFYDFSHLGSPPSASSFFFCNTHRKPQFTSQSEWADQVQLTASANAQVCTVVSGLYMYRIVKRAIPPNMP